MLQVRKTDVTARIPPHVFFFVSAIFHYLGPAFAVLLFSSVSVLGVAWFRIASAAVVFAVWRRPWRIFLGISWTQRRVLLALGIVLGLMNACFYLAIARIPLGTVGAIEFIGPITLAALGARTPRNIGALILAAGGGGLLTDVQFGGQPLGFVFAFANCAFFMLYVVLGHRIAQDGGATGIDRLGAAMLIALVTITPIGITGAFPAMTQPLLLLAGIGVGICSSVIPYVSDQLAMARLKRSTFALLLSLLPASATVIGILVLRQVPTLIEVTGILLVAGGVALHQESDARPKNRKSTPGNGPISSEKSGRNDQGPATYVLRMTSARFSLSRPLRALLKLSDQLCAAWRRMPASIEAGKRPRGMQIGKGGHCGICTSRFSPSFISQSHRREQPTSVLPLGKKERTPHGTEIWFACSPGLDNGSGTYQRPHGSLRNDDEGRSNG